MHKLFVQHRSKHHSGYSGYAKLLAHLNGTIIDGHKVQFPYKIARLLASAGSNKTGNYNSQSVYKELELLKRLLKKRKNQNLVHYLNAERDIQFIINNKNYFPNTKFVATFHKPPDILKKVIKNTKYLEKLDGAICVGENQVDFIKEWLGIEKVVYIPHGVDTQFFRPDSSKEKEHCILFVGQHLRDFEMLNWAIPKLAAFDKSLKIKVVGIPHALKQIIDAENVVKMTGVEDKELKQLYQTSKVLFLPLVDSTACNSILEAMACGLPIVTNDVGGNSSYLNGTNSCFENNSVKLLDATISLILNKEHSIQSSKSLLEQSVEYDWSRIANRINKFYKRISLE